MHRWDIWFYFLICFLNSFIPFYFLCLYEVPKATSILCGKLTFPFNFSSHQNQIQRARSKEQGPNQILVTFFKKKKKREWEDDIGREAETRTSQRDRNWELQGRKQSTQLEEMGIEQENFKDLVKKARELTTQESSKRTSSIRWRKQSTRPKETGIEQELQGPDAMKTKQKNRRPRNWAR